MQASGIKETLDVLKAGAAVCDALVKACEDGKLNFLDLRYVIEPAKAAAEAIRGKAAIGSELKDVDQAELDELLSAGAELGMKVAAAVDALGSVLK